MSNGKAATAEAAAGALTLDLVAGDVHEPYLAQRTPTEPVLMGRLGVNYLCGNCGNVLCAKVGLGLLPGRVFQCAECGRFSRVPGSRHARGLPQTLSGT